jgi:acyl-CoA thioesterase-1
MTVVKRLLIVTAGISVLLWTTAACNPTHGPQPSGAQQQPSDNTSARSAGSKSDPAVVNTPPGAPEDKRPLIVTFGDSLSAGFGADPGKSYPDYLQHLIDRAKEKPYKVLNAGVSGDTTTDGLERLPEILAMRPKIVILELGGNDGLRGLPPATTKANLEKIIQGLQSVNARIVLAGMTLPRNYGPEYIHQFEQIYVQLANQYHLTRIPFLLDGVAGHSNLMQADGIHATAEGNKIVADTVYKYLQPIM